MKVLSLFDGMACGRIALERVGIWVEEYHASEIDKYAIKVAMKNYPDIVQIGDVCKVDGTKYRDFDMLIGGSPCQGFSFAGKQLNFDDPRSALFFEYVRILREMEPTWFLLENVVMKKEYQDVISKELGVRPIMINSALVSAQTRKRLYWTNIPGIRQPEDKGILLKDIIEGGVTEKDKTYAIDAHYGNGTNLEYYLKRKKRQIVFCAAQRGRYTVNGKRQDGKMSVAGLTTQRIEPRTDGKTNALTSVQKDNYVCWKKLSETPRIDGVNEKDGYIRPYKNDGHMGSLSEIGTLSPIKGKGMTVLTSNVPKVCDKCDDEVYYRKLTPIECERLQTVPDNYTEGVSNTQRYRMLGNGWTVDVIAHIFRHLPESPQNPETRQKTLI